MSPGLTARPSGRFSLAPSTPRIRTGSSSSAIAAIASSTAAPPAMSNFIPNIVRGGFSDRPPLSKVTDLPTNPSRGPVAPGGS